MKLAEFSPNGLPISICSRCSKVHLPEVQNLKTVMYSFNVRNAFNEFSQNHLHCDRANCDSWSLNNERFLAITLITGLIEKCLQFLL